MAYQSSSHPNGWIQTRNRSDTNATPDQPTGPIPEPDHPPPPETQAGMTKGGSTSSRTRSGIPDRAGGGWSRRDPGVRRDDEKGENAIPDFRIPDRMGDGPWIEG